MNYSDVDNIVRLGKWAFGEIPEGIRCKDCPLLGRNDTGYKNPYCGLYPVYALNHEGEFGPVFKSSQCPRPQINVT